MAPKLRFGLRDNRARRVVITANNDETDESLYQRQQEVGERNRTNSQLNIMSKEIDTRFHEILWAAEYQTYLVERIHRDDQVSIEFSETSDIDLPDLEKLSLTGEESLCTASYPSFDALPNDIQIRILDARHKDAQILLAPNWVSLQTLVKELTSGIVGSPEDDDIAFRLFDDSSKASFHSITGDIRCANWRDFKVKGCRSRRGAKDHILGEIKQCTDYISVSTSPRRIPNLTKYDVSSQCQKIAIIDLRILRRLGIAYGSTRNDLDFRLCSSG
ncbi:hypothetical protein CLIM01_14360 [Colletotrichum limetticola]|uniref:Uncharacterized protein n=1 Tax=Colletotrichum limetticola TaxID=1209924 RepID=A0ABQ9P869_9PEZI|nr:hypothetical protein CLIM01_14360 [Colletotrichum limetticola]